MKNRRTAVKPLADEPTQTLKEIDQEIARLKERAASIINAEKSGVIERIKEAISYYGLTAAELGFGDAPKAGRRGKQAVTTKASTKLAQPAAPGATAEAAPAKMARAGAGSIKFKDDAGNAWSGFGPKPRWFTEALAAGKTPEDLKA
jgi:DNA-binding protein H-NS